MAILSQRTEPLEVALGDRRGELRGKRRLVMWGVRPTRGASLRVELALGDRRALMSATARTELGADLGDRRSDVGRGADLELGAVCTTSPPIAAAVDLAAAGAPGRRPLL